MTKVSPEVFDEMEMQAVLSVSADILDEATVENKGPPLKDIVAQETQQLSDQHKRLSVRDLASKFDKNLSAAAKLSNEGHVLLKKLRDALEHLRGRLAGLNKDDVEKAISMVEALAVKLTQNEGELIQEKFEVKKLATFLKQEMEEMVEEIQQARRIRLLHHPCKVMDMEHELRALRLQIQEKSAFSVKLQQELMLKKLVEDNKLSLHILEGSGSLGSIYDFNHVQKKQWSSQNVQFSGANKSVYAPEPFDVGRILQVDIISRGQKSTVTTSCPVQPAVELESYVETLSRKGNSEFSLCGFRGGGNVAAKSLFWQSRKGQSFVLVFESEQERNAAIVLARRYALDCNVCSLLP
ncbi:hypothetical protein HanLR1_Chr00c2094g0834281 [Helianthus annuus]|nr:hypothetical protein HanLR1_Chr00c2094g0834281 [Helianthus annuus]